MSYARFHWSLFNVMARVFGIWAAVAAVAFFVSGVLDALNPESVRGDGLTPLEGAITSLVVGVFCGLLSFFLLRVPSYRPDLGDPTWTFQVKRRSRGKAQASRRSWWTGSHKDHVARD